MWRCGGFTITAGYGPSTRLTVRSVSRLLTELRGETAGAGSGVSAAWVCLWCGAG
jgi:hypothetical protein